MKALVVSIDYDHTTILNEIIKIHFNNKNMVYISNRVKSYSVNPVIYKEIEKIKNLVAIVIVTTNDNFIVKIEEELKHYNKPSKICENLTDAIIWANSLIK